MTLRALPYNMMLGVGWCINAVAAGHWKMRVKDSEAVKL
jgi:hypothetical protein